MVRWYDIDGGEFTGIKLKNSPNSHMKLTNSRNIWLHDFEIEVDAWGKLLGVNLPWFGFNTDGIDADAVNMLVERLNITCHDDAVVIKRGDYQCS